MINTLLVFVMNQTFPRNFFRDTSSLANLFLLVDANKGIGNAFLVEKVVLLASSLCKFSWFYSKVHKLISCNRNNNVKFLYEKKRLSLR